MNLWFEVQAKVFVSGTTKAEAIRAVETRLVQAGWVVRSYRVNADDLSGWFVTHARTTWVIEKVGATEDQAKQAVKAAVGEQGIVSAAKAFAGATVDLAKDVGKEVGKPTVEGIKSAAGIGTGVALVALVGFAWLKFA